MSKANRRTAPLALRLAEKERAHLKAQAGERSLHARIRACLLAANDNIPANRIRDRRELAQILAKLGQSDIATNLRSLAKAAKSGTLVMDEATIRAIRRASIDIAEIKTQLMQELRIKEH